MNTPLSKSYDTVRFTITINGIPINDRYPVMSISVENGINTMPKAEIVLLDGDPASRDFLISDSNDFFLDTEIVISAGYDTGPETIIFDGIVVKHAIRIDGGSNSTLSISCKHKAVKMTYNETDSYTYDDDTEDTIIQDIFSEYDGLQGTIKSLPLARQTQQHTSSDWDFIISRCDMHGLHLVFNGNEYSINDPGLTASPVLEVEYGVSMLSFSSDLSADKQASSITGTSWNTKDQKNIKATAKEPTLTGQGNISVQQYINAVDAAPITFSASTPMTQEELQDWVDAQLLRTRLTLIKGQTSFQGSAEVVPGSIISLKGVGTRFSGNVYVSSVTHNISDGNWITSVNFGLDSAQPLSKKSNISATPANGQLPAANGLQTAKVLAISNDPDGLFRVKVLLQSTESEDAGLWARLSTFYATNKNGSFFFPEIGDEVVIGFIDSDPRHPVILGSVYSDARNAAITPPDDNNYVKQLSTNSDLKVYFNDQDKVIEISTPAGNSIKLTEKDESILIVDQNQNSIKMSPDGIEISSCKDISMSAQGDIKINADMSINITATTDLKGAGANVSLEADAQLAVTGQATAELSSSGQTTVKGAIVMIN
jgi:Rhs element Vgr protein